MALFAGLKSRRGHLGGLLAVSAVLAAVLFYYRYLWWDNLVSYYYALSDLYQNREKVRDLLKVWGPWGPLIYIGLQALQVVFAPIPGETTGGFVSGFLFGAPLGVLYSLIGLCLGSVIGFLLGRWLELKVITRWVSPEVQERFEFIMERQGALISLALFALPYFPKDYLCILLGMSPMPFKVFLIVVVIGRLPGTLLFNLQGAQLYAGNYSGFGVLFGVFLVLAGVLYLFRETLYRWLTQLAASEKKKEMKGKRHETEQRG